MLYGYAIAYLVAPDIFDSAHVISFIGGLPVWLKYAGKTILAGPFAYHSLNGLRHLAWDGTKCKFSPLARRLAPLRFLMTIGVVLTLKGAYSSGYAVLGATALTTVGLVLM